MNNNRFIIIPDYAVSHFRLNPAEALVYGVIYGFSRCETHKYFGSLKYIEEKTGLHNTSVCRILKRLTEKGYIRKTVISTRKVEYTAVPIEELKLDDKTAAKPSNLITDSETISGGSNPITDENKSICEQMDAINDKPPDLQALREKGEKRLAEIMASLDKKQNIQ